MRRFAFSAASGVFLLLRSSAGLRRGHTLEAIGDVTERSRRTTEDEDFSSRRYKDMVPKLTNLAGNILTEYRAKPMCYDWTTVRNLPKCYMSGKEKCKLSSISTTSPSTLVYPGGKTRCLNNSFPDFAFQVFPGDTDKLYILFDGGGAEWDRLSTSVQAANKTAVEAMIDSGFIRRGTDRRSPLRNHTILFVQYCSGDLHSGNVTRNYTGVDNGPVHQMGYHNTLSVMNWALDNMQPKLQSLVVSGVSAGAIAAEVWSFKFLRTFKYESARIWADSYVPIFPEHFQGKIFDSLRVCGTDLLEGQEELQKMCLNRTLNIEDVYDASIAAHPQVGFASATTVHDFAQMSFYKLTSLTKFDINGAVFFAQSNFHRRACKMLSRYSQHPNYVSYMMDTEMHIFQLCNDAFAHVQEVNGTKISFKDWFVSFLNNAGATSVANLHSKVPSSCKSVLSGKVMTLQG